MSVATRFAFSLSILSALVLATTAWSGDEDSEPAYMIYIDPETGKYTRDDPDSATHTVVPAQPVPAKQQSKPAWLIAALVLAVLLAAGALIHQRKQTT